MWLPIETAPKDGTPFLVWLSAPLLGSHVHAWSNRTKERSGVICGRFAFDLDVSEKPTHWMPIPAPPTDSN